jgi:hypothetical protein
VACQYCGADGHNVRGCPKRKSDEAAKPNAAVPVVPETHESPVLGPPTAKTEWGRYAVELWGKFVEAVPRLKTPIQLAGFVILVLATFAYRQIAPEHVLGVLVSGAIGVWLFIFATFAPYVTKVEKQHRTAFLLGLAAMFSLLVLALALIAYQVIAGKVAVSYKLKVDKLTKLDLAQEGHPTLLSISVGGTPHELNPNRYGTGSLMLPRAAKHFTVTSAIWRGFDLTSPSDQPINFGDGGIVIDFAESKDYTDRLDTDEIKRLGKRLLGLDSDEQLVKRLGLKDLPDNRVATTELNGTTIFLRNESNDPIIATFVDCDDFVWTKPIPWGISQANINHAPVNRNHTCEWKNVFDPMSVYNKTFAVLISWQNRLGTHGRYRLAGFVVLQPVKNRTYRVFVDGDAENVKLQDKPAQSNVRVIHSTK